MKQTDGRGTRPATGKRFSYFLAPGLLTAIVLLSAALSIRFGSVPLSWNRVVRFLMERDTQSLEARIFLYVRLPRTAACLCTGAGLAVSGAVIQSVLENPLAAPGLIGVNQGAGLAAAFCGVLFPGAAAWMPLAAFMGALAGALLVLFIGESTGASRLSVILAGVAVSAVFSGLIDLLLTIAPDALPAWSSFRVGGFSGVSMSRVLPACAVTAAATVLLLALTPQLDVLALGQETAQALGLRVRPVRFLLLTLAAALSGAAVSVCGLLGFVGLMVPHAMRRFSHGESFPLILFSALGGGAFVTLCDLLGRVLAAPYELPAGVILSLLGGPFFLWLILCRRRLHHA